MPRCWIQIGAEANPVLLFFVSLHHFVSHCSTSFAPHSTVVLGHDYVVFFTPPLLYPSLTLLPPFFFSSVKKKFQFFILPATTLSRRVPSACQLPPERGSDVSGSAFICQWSDLMWDWDKHRMSVVFPFSPPENCTMEVPSFRFFFFVPVTAFLSSCTQMENSGGLGVIAKFKRGILERLLWNQKREVSEVVLYRHSM